MQVSKELLQSNLALWEKSHEPLPRLQSSPWEFCKTGKKEQLNLRRGEETLHSSQNIDVEVRQWVGLFDPHKTEWVIVYGVGLGYYYLGLKNWLLAHPKKHVIFIEDDLAVLYKFLETDVAKQLLEDPQAHLIYLPSDKIRVPKFEELIQKSLFRTIHIGALASYEFKKEHAYQNLTFLIKFFRGIQESSTAEYLGLGRTFFKNFYHNILGLDGSLNGTAFEGEFKGMPAIICGAGPSLGKNIEVLRTLKDRALIFAGGTAMNALNAYHFLPHFGCGIDPFSFHYSRILSNHAFETSYFYRSRMNADAVALLHGPKIYLPGTTGYPIAEKIDEELKFHPFKIDEGSNVINTSLSIAEKLGCNPILFVGLDLAYSNGLSYAEGITSHGIHDPKEQFITKSKQDELVLVKDIYGQPIYTLMKWIVESTWYSSFARNFPHLKLLNCTEGGIGFAEVPNVSLKDAAELYLKESFDCDGKILSILLSKKAAAVPSVEETKSVLNQLVKDLSECVDVMAGLQKKNPELWVEKCPEVAEFETELEKLPAYHYLLKPFDEAFQKYMRGPASQEMVTKLSDIQELLKGRFPYLADIVIENLKYIQKAIKRKVVFEYAKTIGHETAPKIPEIHPIEAKATPSCFYYPSGQLLSLIHYQNGVKEGRAQTFQENGQLLSDRCYHKGLEEGVQLYFYSDGKLKSQIPYKEGLLNGEVKLYYSNGVLKRSCFYKMGKREGVDILNYISGAPLLSAEYQEDKPIGKALMWHIDGPISTEVTYFTPGVIADVKRWDAKGRMIQERDKKRDDIDAAVMSSMELERSLSKMTKGLEGIVHSMKDDFSVQVNHELEEELHTLFSEIEGLKHLSGELLKASGIGGEGKEAIWKTPSNVEEVHAFLQGITSPMQESILKFQWHLKSMIEKIEKQSHE